MLAALVPIGRFLFGDDEGTGGRYRQSGELSALAAPSPSPLPSRGGEGRVRGQRAKKSDARVVLPDFDEPTRAVIRPRARKPCHSQDK